MTARIKGVHEDGYEIDVKRMVMPFRVVDDCPNGCGECEYGDDYWPYPKVGMPSEVTMYCPECDAEWDVTVQIDFIAKIIEPPKCCVCGTTEGLRKDGWYGYRCSSPNCVCF